jgi:hypothetical protein
MSITLKGQEWWNTAVIPDTREAVTGGCWLEASPGNVGEPLS